MPRGKFFSVSFLLCIFLSWGCMPSTDVASVGRSSQMGRSLQHGWVCMVFRRKEHLFRFHAQMVLRVSHSMWIFLLLFVTSVAIAAPCPSYAPVTADLHAVGCSGLMLMVAVENITLTRGCDGSDQCHLPCGQRAGTTLRLWDRNVTGNLTLRGPHSFADVWRSIVTGVDVVGCYGSRNVTVVVKDSTLTGGVVASVLASAVGSSIMIVNSTLIATRYAASVVGSRVSNVRSWSPTRTLCSTEAKT